MRYPSENMPRSRTVLEGKDTWLGFSPRLIYAFSTTCLIAAGGAVVLHSMGQLSFRLAALVLAAPLIALVITMRPSWVVLGLMAVPPGLLAYTTYRPMAVLLIATLIAQLVIRGRVFLGPSSGLYPLALLLLGSLVFSANVGADAAFSTETFVKQFSYYLLLALVSYNATRLGDLRLEHLVTAILLGAFLTGLLKLSIGGLGPAGQAGVADPALLFFGRNYAYIAVIGFSICFTEFLLASKDPKRYERQRYGYLSLGIFFLILIAPSLVRGAWLLAVATVLVVSWLMRKGRYWLIVPLAAVVFLAVPVARERLTNEQARDTDITTGRWELWSTVWEKEIADSLPWGNGFGYSWTLTPEHLFGFEMFVIEGEGQPEFVYLHSDLLFWLVEYGLLGAAALALFWTHFFRTCRRLYRHSDRRLRNSVLLFTGIIIVMFFHTLFGNALAFRPLPERFFVISGFLFGLYAVAQKNQDTGSSGGPSQSRTDQLVPL